MLVFFYCMDGKLRQREQLTADNVVMFACQADYNHTDIILLFDDEVAQLILDQLFADELDEWLWLMEIDEWLEQ